MRVIIKEEKEIREERNIEYPCTTVIMPKHKRRDPPVGITLNRSTPTTIIIVIVIIVAAEHLRREPAEYIFSDRAQGRLGNYLCLLARETHIRGH